MQNDKILAMKKKIKIKKTTYGFNKDRSLLIKDHVFNSYQNHQIIVNNTVKNVKKDYGIFFTPERIVDMMVNLIDIRKLVYRKEINILEPACGLAQFLMGIKRNKLDMFNKSKSCRVDLT